MKQSVTRFYLPIGRTQISPRPFSPGILYVKSKKKKTLTNSNLYIWFQTSEGTKFSLQQLSTSLANQALFLIIIYKCISNNSASIYKVYFPVHDKINVKKKQYLLIILSEQPKSISYCVKGWIL